MQSQVAHVPTGFYRYLFPRINWHRQMYALMGPRGIGKSTMFLQYFRNTRGLQGNASQTTPSDII